MMWCQIADSCNSPGVTAPEQQQLILPCHLSERQRVSNLSTGSEVKIAGFAKVCDMCNCTLNVCIESMTIPRFY